jgi:hypothetical protein
MIHVPKNRESWDDGWADGDYPIRFLGDSQVGCQRPTIADPTYIDLSELREFGISGLGVFFPNLDVRFFEVFQIAAFVKRESWRIDSQALLVEVFG